MLKYQDEKYKKRENTNENDFTTFSFKVLKAIKAK